MPERDQTRWIGVRPVSPAENIPVTESAPLTSIEVEPAPGCANFPVTESAPLTSIEVEPTPGSANFPVTESAPLTDILVAPSAGNPQFETLTKKRSPATADLQAYEYTKRHVNQGAAGAAGVVNRDSTACPVGKVWLIQAIYSVNASSVCTGISHMIRTSGGISYFINLLLNPAAGVPLITLGNYILHEGDYIRSNFTGIPFAADWLQFSVVGYYVDVY